MKTLMKQLILPCLAFALAGSIAVAVPYASSVVREGNTVTYVLNQSSASVALILDGGSPVAMGTTPGVYNFDMTGHTTYEIKVTGNETPGWTQYVPEQESTAFYVPYGVSINKIPGSPNFGKVYVSEALGGTTGGRTTSDGIYVLRADGADDGWFNGGLGWGGGSNPFQSTIGPDGHLYVADLSNDLAYEFNDDMSVASQLIDDSNKTTGQYVRSIYVTGTKAAGNRKIYLVDSHSTSTRKGLIEYDLGANDTAIGLGTGTQIIGPTYYQASYYPYDVARDSSGNWYVNAYRGILDQMPAITKFNGAGLLPLDDDVIWETDKAVYYYAWCIDIDEARGLAAYGSALNGFVYFFNMDTGAFIQSFDAGTFVRELAFDAAGNLVTVDNNEERARFWSPGGYTVATTSFNGSEASFQLVRPAAQVSITATQATVPEGGPAVNFTISRAVATGSDLSVHYTVGGSAVNGTDYATLSGAAVIPAGATSVNVALTPLEDTIAELSETVVLSLSADPNYSVVVPASSTVSILDNEAPEISFATADPKKLLESYAPSKVTHQVIRRGLLTSALTVNLSYTGTALPGADFNAPATAEIAAGGASANVVLTPINDQAYEGNETATANIAAGTGYAIGAESSISATVVDDEPPPGTVLFSDDFDADSSALWQVNMADPYPTSFAEFAWDYGTLAGIPPAPGTTDGSTKGLRLRTGNVLLQNDGISVSPLNENFIGDYRLKFDMWINYNGPMGVGGPGSTQNFDAGVGTAGDTTIWQYNPGSDAVWFSLAGDGQSETTYNGTEYGGDYYALVGIDVLDDDSGVYAAGTSATPDSGLRDSVHPYYSLWGGQTAPAAQIALYSGQTGTVAGGTPGMEWHTVVITKVGDVVTWVIDGITIATVTNSAASAGNNVFVGYQDLWSGSSLSNVPEMSFGLVDNLRVQTLSAPTAPVITGIQLINNGTQVRIAFTGGVSDLAAAFGLVGSPSVTGTFNTVSASITSPAAGQFEAVTSVGSGNQFFRVRRN